jgi:glycosyltransferase involved in cell wall biosynthesis
MGGAEASLLSLLERLDRNKYFPVTACPANGMLSKKLHQLEIQMGFFAFERFKKDRNIFTLVTYLFRYFTVLWKLVSFAAKYRIHLIHANSTNAQIYGSVTARILRIPSIWHVRDIVPLGILGRIMYLLSTKIIVPSEAVRNHVLNYGSSDKYKDSRKMIFKEDNKVIKIYNGIDVVKWAARNKKLEARSQNRQKTCNLRNEFAIGLDKWFVAMIGQLVFWKKHKDFINSASIVLKEIPNVKFLIVGEDSFGDHPGYKGELQNLCKCLNIRDKFIFTGYRCDIPLIMAAIDVLVLPSCNEPFGRVVLEAMAMEKPVIATNTGGPPEIIEDAVTGILVPPEDPEKLAEAIIHLLKNADLRMKMGNAGRERIEECFDIGKILAEVEAVYELFSNR